MYNFQLTLKKFNHRNEIVLFFILFLASASIVTFQFLEWDNSEEKIKHNAFALFTGDEPFYLEVVSSIVRHQSLSTSAHFTSLEKDPFLELTPVFYEVHSCRLHHGLTASDGECYIQNLGMPIILSPAYSLFGFVGSMLTVSLLFSFQGVILYKISNKFTSKKLGFFLTLLVSFTTISFSFSSEIYPDFFGGFFLLLILYFFYFRTTNFVNIIIVGFSLGFLPLIKFYFFVFPLILLPIMLFILLKNRRYNNIFHLLASFTIFILLFLSVSVLTAPVEVAQSIGGGYTWYILDYFVQNFSNLLNLVNDIGIGTISLLFDQSTGIIAFSPILLVSLFGIKYAWKKDKFFTVSLVAITFSFIGLFAFYSPYPGGWSLPGRNIIPILPMLLILIFPIFERFKKSIPFHFLILIFSYVGISLNIIFARTIYGHFSVDEREKILSHVYYGISQYFPQMITDFRLPYPHLYEEIHPFFSIFIIFLLLLLFLFTFSTIIKNILKNKKYRILFFITLVLLFISIFSYILNSYDDYNTEREINDTFDQVLKRQPTLDEFASWKNSLLNNEITIENLKKSLSDSEEGIVVSKISVIYQDILQREPDSIGLKHWKQQIINNEINFKQLETMMRNSSEAGNIIEN